MIDQVHLKEILEDYKRDFDTAHWAAEGFKWEAVQWFQDHWDIDAEDFPAMLERSLEKAAKKLLVSKNHFPAGMIVGLAEKAPEEVRAMFAGLFDEQKDLGERILAFREQVGEIFEKYDGREDRNHYQNENVITTYLWLRYPDRYYIYKFGEVRSVTKAISTSYHFKAGAYQENLSAFWQLYDEIAAVLRGDPEMRALLDRYLTAGYYPDPALHTMTIDVGFYISRQKKDVVWEPVGYDPGLSVGDWAALLADEAIFGEEELALLQHIRECGGEASTKLLAEKYGGVPNYYNGKSVGLARRVAEKTKCELSKRSNGRTKWWPVLYKGRDALKGETGTFVWRLQDELAEALAQLEDAAPEDLPSSAAPKADVDITPAAGRGYWWLNANPKIWRFSKVGVGETQYYTLYNENGRKRKVAQHFLDVRPGDPVIGYETSPSRRIVALGMISQASDGEKIGFQKVEDLSDPIAFDELSAVQGLENAEPMQSRQGSLFKLSEEEYGILLDLIRERNPKPDQAQQDEPYTRRDFLEEVYMEKDQLDRLLRVLGHKKNIILQGAPGVGKTFAAERLAYAMMGEKDDSRITFVQFHQNYTYEDFVMGYKPLETGFALKTGIFYQFCQKASNRPDKPFFFLIDEINRGNLSKIFGELLMAIEADYRGKSVCLAYDGLPFAVPENLYIIGMMNTADRSLALIDYALRRRFSFFELVPGFDSTGFAAYQAGIGSTVMDALIDQIRALNQEIAQDPALGRGFMIGHSYFCDRDVCVSAEGLQDIVEFDILPMLEEYWFDNEDRLMVWRDRLRGVFQ